MSRKTTSVYLHDWVTRVLGGRSSALGSALEFLAASVLHAMDRNAGAFSAEEWRWLAYTLATVRFEPADPHPGAFLAGKFAENLPVGGPTGALPRAVRRKLRALDGVRCLALLGAVGGPADKDAPPGAPWWTKESFLARGRGIDF